MPLIELLRVQFQVGTIFSGSLFVTFFFSFHLTKKPLLKIIQIITSGKTWMHVLLFKKNTEILHKTNKHTDQAPT